jgi:hypothetical protein
VWRMEGVIMVHAVSSLPIMVRTCTGGVMMATCHVVVFLVVVTGQVVLRWTDGRAGHEAMSILIEESIVRLRWVSVLCRLGWYPGGTGCRDLYGR